VIKPIHRDFLTSHGNDRTTPRRLDRRAICITRRSPKMSQDRGVFPAARSL
jgi:hypothetical protein